MVPMNTARGEDPALSYRNMRAITGYVGLTLPVALLLAGAADGHVESSLSAYYYTKMGNVFTGSLCVIGVFLVAYRVAAWAWDNYATTLAGGCALGVAFFHAAPANATPNQVLLSDVHLSCAAALFILLGAEFLALILVIVYVGAVAVLFLFVVMMLDINFVELRRGFLQYLPIGFTIGAILAIELLLVFGTWAVAPTIAQPLAQAPGVTNTQALGALLYTRYVYAFQAAGMVLLVAMIGAIVLTLRTREGVRRQKISQQVGRRREDTLEIVKVRPRQGI